MSEEKKKRKRKGERKDGRIQVTFTVGYKPDGKPDRKVFYGYTREEAEKNVMTIKRNRNSA